VPRNPCEDIEALDPVTAGRCHATVSAFILIVLIAVVTFLGVLNDHVTTDCFFLAAGVRTTVTADEITVVTLFTLVLHTITAIRSPTTRTTCVGRRI